VGEEMLQKHCNILSSTHAMKRAFMTLSRLLNPITCKTKKNIKLPLSICKMECQVVL
jgi:hypothetical protein